mgnify:CR=1 FL=1
MGADDHPEPFSLRDLVPADLLDDLQAFMCTRMDRLELRKISADYQSLEDAAAGLYDQMEAAVPEAARQMLSELYECYTSLTALAAEMYYRHGFTDGVRMIVLGCAPWPEEIKAKETGG